MEINSMSGKGLYKLAFYAFGPDTIQHCFMLFHYCM
jgi:hypothetical protein